MEHRVPAASPQHEQQKAGQSVRAPNINSLSLDKLLKVVVTIVQQTMAESSDAVLEEAKILAIKKLSKISWSKVATRIHRPLKVIGFNANGIMRQRYELSKQLQDLHVNVAFFSETHLKPHERFFISNYNFYRTDRHPGRKGGTAVAVRIGVPHTLFQ
jgi:hypothetical protein